MAANFERRKYDPNARIWIGKYQNLHNLPHWHLEYELIACRDGNAELTLDGIRFTLSDGTAAFCPSGCVHHISADANATLLVAQIDGKLLRFLGQDIRLQNPVFPDHYGICESFDAILGELKSRRPYYDRRAEAVMVQLLIDIFRQEETAIRNEATQSTAASYRDLLSAIDEESEFITFADAAARMNMSQAYFSRYFKHSAGMTFSEYLNLVKVDKAIGILEADPKISTSDLALRCGFNTLRSFNRVFHKITGYSPKQLPNGYSLHIRQYAVGQEAFDPTLSESISL